MYEDDILREIWDYREAYARRFDFDIDAMLADLRSRQEAEGRPVVRSVADHQAAQAGPSTENDLQQIEAAKEEFARRFNYDVRAMMDAIREQDRAGDRLVVRSVEEHQAAQAKRSPESLAAETPVPVPHDS